jgi:fatty acid desaturase
MNGFAIPWRLNLGIAAAQILAAVFVFWLTAEARTWWELLILAATFAILGNSIYALMHEAEHGILAPCKWLNDGLGVVLALFFPAPFHLLRQGHLGHHLRNRSDDEAFDFYFAGESKVWKWLQLYGILTGFFWITIVLANLAIVVYPAGLQRRTFQFDRPTAALLDSLNPRYWRAIRCEAAAVLLVHAFILWSLNIPLANYAIVYLGFGFTWSAMQYVHHFGTERHVVNGSRNLWVFPVVDLLWLNHNWHHTHHLHPTAPWIHLPRLSTAQSARQEFLLWHYLRMWAGPRLTDQHVENRYAGQVVR